MLSGPLEVVAAVQVEGGAVAEGLALLQEHGVRLVGRHGLHRREVRRGGIPRLDLDRGARGVGRVAWIGGDPLTQHVEVRVLRSCDCASISASRSASSFVEPSACSLALVSRDSKAVRRLIGHGGVGGG